MNRKKEKNIIKKSKGIEVPTFTVPLALEVINENRPITINTAIKTSKDQLINQAFKAHSEGNIKEAEKYYKSLLDYGFSDPKIYSNYGVLLINIGKLKEAEIYTRKAIDIDSESADTHFNLGAILKAQGRLEEAKDSTYRSILLRPDYAYAYYNLGSILIDIGNIKEAHEFLVKSIDIDPNLSSSYYTLSKLNDQFKNKTWRNKLFADEILKNKSQNEKIDLFFARANILHCSAEYNESHKYLELANKTKLTINSSNLKTLLEKSETLKKQASLMKTIINKKNNFRKIFNIFIVGMPRSGSTLVESTITMNKGIYALGEINLFEESYLEWLRLKDPKNDLTLNQIYNSKLKNIIGQSDIASNKWLYNYQYSGVILSQMNNIKIIHCFRNPLDNILSIYRSNLCQGNEYSSSLVDCAKVYLNQDEIMTEYKNKFRSKIYDLNYDELVYNPHQEIKSLISWLGWEWDDTYLSPHLNKRSVSTASSVQVRSPINSKSIGGWKNYRKMLDPAIEVLAQSDKYKNLKFL